jgi:hypothetical protein
MGTIWFARGVHDAKRARPYRPPLNDSKRRQYFHGYENMRAMYCVGDTYFDHTGRRIGPASRIFGHGAIGRVHLALHGRLVRRDYASDLRRGRDRAKAALAAVFECAVVFPLCLAILAFAELIPAPPRPARYR